MFPFKVCCIKSAEEADMAIAAGAQAVGLVGEMPSGPGPISDDEIKTIASHVHARHESGVWTTLLTSRTDAAGIIDHVGVTDVNTVQLVDGPEHGAYAKLRRAFPLLRIIQVIHVQGEDAIEAALEASHDVDVILLDSGKPNAAVKTFGGTGMVHDWTISKRIVSAVAKPVFLAGGLNPENVAKALAAVRPYGVDICSGLRDAQYRLEAAKLAAFASILQSGDEAL